MRVSSSLPYSGLGLTLFAALGAAAPAQQVQRLGAPNGSKEKVEAAPTRTVVHPVQLDWRDLVELQASLPRTIRPEQPLVIEDMAASGASEVPDPVVPMPDVDLRRDNVLPEPGTSEGGVERFGNCTGFPVLPPASLSTPGQGDGPDSFATLFYPPNAAGSVGPNHLMVMAPNFTLVQDRDGVSVSSVDTLTFWSPTGAASVTYCRLDYAQIVGRWIATARGGSGVGGTSILFAISDTDDPTGSWDFYSVAADPTLAPPTFADGLKMGFNQTWVAVTADMYSSTAVGGNQGSRLYTFDMAAALLGGPVTVNTFPSGFWFSTTGVFNALINWRLVPARSLDTSLSDIYILTTRVASAASPLFQMCRITGTGAAPTMASTPGSLFAPATSSLMFLPLDYTNTRQTVAQVGDVRLIDPLQPDGAFASTRARLADIVVRNSKLFVVHNAGLPAPTTAPATQNAVMFYELDPFGPLANPTIGSFNQNVQITEGVNTTLFYPSIAVNCAEDVLIGFSRANATIDLQAACAMRLGSDPLNTMGPVTTLKLGESSWWQLGPPPATTLGAWGFYSSTSIDPNDDTTMWTLQPYAATRVGAADADSRWGTWWGRYGDCNLRPVITDHPDDVPGCIGDTVSFSVTATTGTNPLLYQWRLNGVDILGANSDTYMIPSVVSADEGVYDVVVCGCGFEISLPATLELDEPTITVQPQNYLANVGEPAAFFVVATPSLGSLSYQWFHGATPVGTNDDILVLGPVSYADFGPYHCVVTDGCGPAMSSSANLFAPTRTQWVDQTEPNLQIVEHPESALACVGSTAVLSVFATPNDADYEWRYNGSPIVPPQTNSSLVISPVSLADDGIYDVVVSKGPNSKTSLPAALTVIDLPVITVQPSPSFLTVSPGANVLYSVTATGGGTLTYQWEFRPQSGGGGVSFSPIPFANGPTHGIEGATSLNNGTYRCKITNECGFVRTINLRLTVI